MIESFSPEEDYKMSKILIVDDAAFVRMQYKKSLLNQGYEVIEASNGTEALELYKDIKPDGVLLDINMPDKDGIVTLHEIISIDPKARVAMVTCVGSQSIILTALQAGAKDFIIKPAEKDGLIDVVEKLLS